MDPESEQRYIEMATENPTMLCSEVPLEILQAASYAGDEPTGFLRTLLAAGYSCWVSETHGTRIHLAKEQVDVAVLVLWVRACGLYTSKMTGQPDDDWDKPFFSDEGLYD